MGRSRSRGHHLPLAVLTVLLAGTPAVARAGCVWTDLVRDEARVATLRSAAPRTYFVKDDVLARGCPNDGAACRDSAYLTPGDTVLTGPSQGRFTCAGFVGTKGATTIGWLPNAALSASDPGEPPPDDWTGHWVAPEQDVTIAPAAGGALSVKGDATWGLGDPDRRRRGGVHIGEIAGTVRPSAGVLAFTMGENGATVAYDAGDESDCRVRMVRRGPYLVVRDNNACGGANVSFSGFYRRKG